MVTQLVHFIIEIITNQFTKQNEVWFLLLLILCIPINKALKANKLHRSLQLLNEHNYFLNLEN